MNIYRKDCINPAYEHVSVIWSDEFSTVIEKIYSGQRFLLQNDLYDIESPIAVDDAVTIRVKELDKIYRVLGVGRPNVFILEYSSGDNFKVDKRIFAIRRCHDKK
jgi:hypothetical protein